MMSPAEALKAWSIAGPTHPADNGLINQTYLVGDPPKAVLQWVNPIFSTEIQHDIQALTKELQSQGLVTPRLIPCRDQRLWLDDAKGFWRLMTFVPGRTFHRLSRPSQAEAAGRALGQFHRAVKNWRPTLRAPDRAAHHTPARMDHLRQALTAGRDHPLSPQAERLGDQILKSWDRWDGDLNLPRRLCHGDPKVSNLRFDAEGRHGVCWLDLDTFGYQTLGDELGDAWRSWCNPAGEDHPDQCRFDLELFTASAQGWCSEVGALESGEVEALAAHIERLCLELAARFCADVVENTYFQEDRERFPQAGEHNLLKAQCQYALAESARDRRQMCERTLRELKA